MQYPTLTNLTSHGCNPEIGREFDIKVNYQEQHCITNTICKVVHVHWFTSKWNVKIHNILNPIWLIGTPTYTHTIMTHLYHGPG